MTLGKTQVEPGLWVFCLATDDDLEPVLCEIILLLLQKTFCFLETVARASLRSKAQGKAGQQEHCRNGFTYSHSIESSRWNIRCVRATCRCKTLCILPQLPGGRLLQLFRRGSHLLVRDQ